jgi:hypothetical protein
VKAAFLTSAGYGEAGDEGRRAEAELVALADELGILLAGPNGQGVVSTPATLCAQIVAPFPPAGRIGVASQSGNFVSELPQLRPPDRCGHQPRGLAPATRPRSPRPTTSTGTPTTRHRGVARLRRGHRRRPVAARPVRVGRGAASRSWW